MQQAIRRELPTLSSRLKVKKLMRQEELVRNILHTRRLGADLSSPQKKRKGSEAGEDQPELAAGFRCRIPSSRRRAQEQVLEVLAAGQDLAHV